ncbi:MAG: hypothetical protein ACE5JI_22915 [Acidobacteriota bacterium]
MTTWGRESIPLSRLREILERRRGERRAITAHDLALILGLKEKDGRSIREAVNQLIEAGHPIGSSTRNGGGYFRIETEAELQHCLGQYRSRVRELEKRMEHLVRAFAEGPRQPALL